MSAGQMLPRHVSEALTPAFSAAAAVVSQKHTWGTAADCAASMSAAPGGLSENRWLRLSGEPAASITLWCSSQCTEACLTKCFR